MTKRIIAYDSGGSGCWSIVEILGTTNVRMMILKFTFFTRERNCQFAGDAGAK
jgi:hypothetical protein